MAKVAYVSILLLLSSTLASTGMVCEDHPLASTVDKGVLISSWSYAPDVVNHQYWVQSVYLPRYTKHVWAPLEDNRSTKYANLDYFNTHNSRRPLEDFFTIKFQREAKVYLLVSGHIGGPVVTLKGWNSEGWVQLTPETIKNRTIEIGLGKRKLTASVPSRGYVFSRVGKTLTIPSYHIVGEQLLGMTAKGYWSLLIAEADGSPSTAPTTPNGIIVKPNSRCPEALHDAWVTSGTDVDDLQTYGRMFRTYHPLWDPCYWCAYDHEHGSNAKALMGYVPRYGYTALKNGKQDESHKGFKDIVMEVNDKFVYYGMHAHMSSGKRFGTRHHTLVIAVTDKQGELELELRFKADFGHREARLAGNVAKIPLTPEDERLRNEMAGKPRRVRIVNVVNPGNLDRSLNYRGSPNERIGEYEQWFTVPICSLVKRFGEPAVDFKDMGLALRYKDSGVDDIVELGRTHKGVFAQGASVDREFRARDFEIGQSFCNFSNPDGSIATQVSGKFYTDPYGKIILEKAGPAACAQFIKPGFSIRIEGSFETMDTWFGLYQDGKEGHIRNIALGVLESEN